MVRGSQARRRVATLPALHLRHDQTDGKRNDGARNAEDGKKNTAEEKTEDEPAHDQSEEPRQ